MLTLRHEEIIITWFFGGEKTTHLPVRPFAGKRTNTWAYGFWFSFHENTSYCLDTAKDHEWYLSGLRR